MKDGAAEQQFPIKPGTKKSPSVGADLPASFFRTVIETANEGIWMIDCDGLTTFANDRMATMLGTTAAKMLGTHPREYLVADDLPMASEVIRQTLGGEPQEFEPRFVRADGSELPTLAGTAPIRDEAGDIVGAVATFSDITAYKAAEQALVEREAEASATATLLNSLLTAARDAIWMRDVDGVFRVANPAACEVMGGTHDEIIGRSMHRIWGSEVGAHLAAETATILAGGKAVTVEEEMFDAARNRITIFLSSKVPLYAANGSPIGILGVSRDITKRKADENALRESQGQLARQLAEVNALYSSAPIGLGFFDREYRYIRINDELAAINGMPANDHIGRSLREVLPHNAPKVEPVIDRVFETGEAVRDLEISGQTPQQPGVVRHWLTGFYPVKDSGGAVIAVGAWVVEISERKAAEQREVLLAREVDHRAKNLLAVVQSVVQLTRADTAEELKQGVMGRIQALASAHALLAESRWEGVDLSQLVIDEMAPFSGGPNPQVAFTGPPLRLSPAAAQSLALVLHELATNAAKYGALATAEGRLIISWQRVDEPSNSLVLNWAEKTSEPVAEPTASGFGSKIIRASVERQLRGRVTQRWFETGLHCTLELPLLAVVAAADLA